jgi:hypothetical protein
LKWRSCQQDPTSRLNLHQTLVPDCVGILEHVAFVKDANLGPAPPEEREILLPEGKIVRRNDYIARSLLYVVKNALLVREAFRL